MSKPPSFFKIDDDTMDLDDSDYYLYPKEEKASAAFGEGRTILSLGKADVSSLIRSMKEIFV